MSKLELAWIDIETTGLDANLDVPLEIGIRLTDGFGNGTAYIEWLVWEDTPEFQRGVERGYDNEFVRKMHTDSGLWEALEEDGVGFTRDRVDEQLVSFLQKHQVADRSLPMAGSSIGSLDRPFVLRHFPKFNAALSYRNVDVSSIKEVCKLTNPGLYENLRSVLPKKDEADHRVFEDVMASIKEYQTYLDEFLMTAEEKY